MSGYFPEPKFSGGRVKVELDFSNYATKADLKNATGVDTSKFAKKVDLAHLKTDLDKINIEKLKNVSIYAKIKNIEDKIPDITNLGTNNTLDAKINEVKNEISSITNLVTTTALNAKIKVVKNKIFNISNLTTTAALTAEGKIPNPSNLAK